MKKIASSIFLFVVFNGVFWSVAAMAAEPASENAVVATVGEEPIEAREVNRWLEKVTRGKTIPPEGMSFLRDRILEEIINRRLVLAYARRTGQSATESEIDKALADVKSRLAAQRKTFAEYLQAQSVTEAELRRQLEWNVVWEKCLAKYITPERLEKYFDAHRREFDGTELSVSHILLAIPPGEKEKGIEAIIARVQTIREEIVAGKVSFAEAAKKHSTGPSGKDGGKIGLIGRQGPMDVSFSKAAFALKEGEISPPVRSPFGIHLIRCDAVQPGKKQFADAESQVRDALARELLEKLAASERTHTPVKYMVPPMDK
jgi:parvulin-like peptidyl-prolyl isomerase